MQLPVADVERDHARGAELQENVREPAGGGADVEAVAPGRVDAEGVERVRELLAAARDEARAALDLELGRLVHLLAGLRVPGDEACEHERLRLGTALREAPFDEQDVQPLLRHA